MPEECSIAGRDDILYDLEGTSVLASEVADFFARGADVERRPLPRPRRTRGGLPRALTGRLLMSRCPDGSWRRYETLLYFEELFPREADAERLDYGYLIGPACQILETELDRLLTTPARPIAGALAEALRSDGSSEKQAEILDLWKKGELPTTMGVECLLLLALQRAYKQGINSVIAFLTSRFERPYLDLLTSKSLVAGLEKVRSDFRNIVAHGKGTFQAAAYEEFVNLVVANNCFAEWDKRGPRRAEPDPGTGVLHHHLSLALANEAVA